MLILGTSISMIERIIQHLELPCAEKIIHIEDITSHETSIGRAAKKASILYPSDFWVKGFSGFFIDPFAFSEYGEGRHLQTLENCSRLPTAILEIFISIPYRIHCCL